MRRLLSAKQKSAEEPFRQVALTQLSNLRFYHVAGIGVTDQINGYRFNAIRPD